jgi:hypothetical protein
MQGSIESAVEFYETQVGGQSGSLGHFHQAPKPDSVTITAVSMAATSADDGTGAFPAGSPLTLEIQIESPSRFPGATIGFTVCDRVGNALFTSHHDDIDGKTTELVPGLQTYTIRIDPNLLLPGRYTLTIGITDSTWTLLTLESECLEFEIQPMRSQTASHVVTRPGALLLPFDWKRS